MDNLSDKKLKKQLLKLLLLCDHEFIPNLSLSPYRFVDTEKFNQKELLEIYINQKKNSRSFVFAFHGNQLVGFVNFMPLYQNKQFQDFEISTHVDTICVLKDYRNQGISKKFYKIVEKITLEKFHCSKITISTWATNDIQKHLLPKLGYSIIFKKISFDSIEHLFYGKNI